MAKPNVSVILPIYNVADYLGEALESLYRQCNVGIEVIMVNDQSTDSTLEVAESWRSNWADITTLVTIEHSGLSTARNIGLSLATGDYIFFMDGDDLLAADSLNSMLSICRKYNLQVLQCDHTEFYSESSLYNTTKWDSLPKGVKPSCSACGKTVMSGRDLFVAMWRNGTYTVPVWRNMYSRQFLVNNSIHFEESIYFEDHLFTFEVLSLAERTMYIKNVIYHRRIRAGSLTDQMQTRQFTNAMRVTAERIDRILNSEQKSCFTDAAGDYLDYLKYQLSNAALVCQGKRKSRR